MATQSLNRIYFPIFRKTSGDAGRSLKDPIGVFSCNMNAARFLDIASRQVPLPVMVRNRQASQRSLTLADGTTLVRTEQGAQIAASKIVVPVSGKGSRTVILQTGKLIADSQRRKNKQSAFHTISFRFPSFCTVLTISEALGELIPPNKIKNPPGATDIWGYFTVKAGRRYPIMLGTEAEQRPDVDVALLPAEVQALEAKAQELDIIAGAGI